MKVLVQLAGLGLLALTACGEPAEQARPQSLGGEGEVASFAAMADKSAADETASAAPLDQIPVSAPQIAYSYRLGFEVPLGAIKSAQERHAQMCEDLGQDTCQIIAMQQSDDGEDYASGRLEIAVTAAKARAFTKSLEAATGDLDGELTSSSLTGEDLSKQLVDTEARLRSRELLRDRLMDILATRRGSVEELAAAERSVALVNQEIDQARSWLAEMRGRVAFSDITINYEAGARSPVGGFSGPIATAWNSLGAILGSVIAGLMVTLTATLPIIILMLALRWVLHRFGYRLRFWKTDLPEAEGPIEN